MEQTTVKAILILNKNKGDHTLLSSFIPPFYFLIEIKRSLPFFNALTYKIVRTITENKNDFGAAIKQTNQMLAEIAKKGEIDWVDGFSSLIAKIENEELSLASAGNASCFLIREDKITNITANQKQEVNVQQTFEQILNGELKEKDILVLGNDHLFETLPIKKIQQLLSGSEEEKESSCLEEAAFSIAQQLKEKTGPKPFSLFLATLQKEKQAHPAKAQAKTIYIEEVKNRNFKKFLGKMKFFSGKRKKWLLILFALFFIGLLAIKTAALVQKRLPNIRPKQSKLLLEAEDKFRQANEALKNNNKDTAAKLYQEALKLASGDKTKKGASLVNKINFQLDKLDNVHRVNPKLVLDLSVFKDLSLSRIFVIDKDIFCIDGKNGRIFQNKTNTASLPQAGGEFVDASYQPQDNLLLLYLKTGGVYQYQIQQQKIEKVKIVFDENWQKARLIGTYFSNIYLLSPQEGQIYKYQKLANEYSKAVPYLEKKQTDLKNVVSMTLDGYIYLLKNDGSVIKLMAGKEVADFSLLKTPSSWKTEQSTKIFTTTETPHLFILSGNQILEFDKSGNYLRMFVVQNIEQPKDFWVDYHQQKIYLLTNSRVFMVKM